MLTLQTLETISSSENNAKMLDWFLQTYRSMTETEPRNRLLRTMIERNMFYVPVGSYLQQIFGLDVKNEFFAYYPKGVCALTKSLCMPLKTLSDDILGLVLNNPNHEEKYRYPMTGTFNKSRYLQMSRKSFLKALKIGYIIIVEGVFDELSLASLELPVCGLSGSSINWERAQILDNIPVKIIISDEDSAGARMLSDSQKMFSGKIICTRLPVKDIDQFLRSEENSQKFMKTVTANEETGWSIAVMDLR